MEGFRFVELQLIVVVLRMIICCFYFYFPDDLQIKAYYIYWSFCTLHCLKSRDFE